MAPGKPDKHILRTWGADCYIKAGNNAEAAAGLLRQKIGGRFSLSHPTRFCQTWGERRLNTGTVTDAPRSGRPKKLSQAWVDRVITALSHGYERIDTTGTKRLPYRTWSQFCRESPVAAACLGATKVTPEHLLRVCMQTLPTLKRVKIQFKVWLKPAVKAQRIADSTTLLSKPSSWFKAVVWLDAKTLYINPTSCYAWINTATMSPHELTREDKRVRARGKELVKLKFYIAVNALCGPVKLVWVTGTTGMAYDRNQVPYLVRLAFNDRSPMNRRGCSTQSPCCTPIGAPEQTK